MFVSIPSDEAMQKYPPVFSCTRKQQVMDMLLQHAIPPSVMVFSQWEPTDRPLPLNDTLGTMPEVSIVSGYFDYNTGPQEWHVNFADVRLFGYAESTLFAQDEWQVLEHPDLICARNWVSALNTAQRLSNRAGPNEGSALTRQRDGTPTPCLVENVHRRLSIDVSKGLYGNAFCRAEPWQIEEAVTILDPPTVSNIIAMVAPQSNRLQVYSAETLQDILVTTVTAFAAARLRGATAIHTGHWGCGAFGHEPVVMAALQILAARMTEMPLVYHAGDNARPVEQARDLVTTSSSGKRVLQRLFESMFFWGEGNGT